MIKILNLIKKIAPLLIFGLVSQSYKITAADNNTCNYKSIKEFKECLSSGKINLNQNFPAYFGDGGGDEHKFILFFYCPNEDKGCLEIRKKYKAIRLTSKDGKNIEVGYGKISTWTFQKFKIKDKLNIPSENIISWSKKPNYISENWNNFKFDIYNISYIDKLYNLKNLYFLFASENNYAGNTRIRVQQHSQYVDRFLKSITNLENNEISNGNNQRIFNKAIKEMEVIKSIIDISKNANCVELNELKFSELSQKYRILSKNINPLRAKLDLPPSTDLKPICN